MLENLSYPALLWYNKVRNNNTLSSCQVTKRPVQTISRKGLSLLDGLMNTRKYR